MDKYTLDFILLVVGTMLMYFTGGFVFLMGVYLMGKGVFNLFRKLG